MSAVACCSQPPQVTVGIQGGEEAPRLGRKRISCLGSRQLLSPHAAAHRASEAASTQISDSRMLGDASVQAEWWLLQWRVILSNSSSATPNSQGWNTVDENPWGYLCAFSLFTQNKGIAINYKCNYRSPSCLTSFTVQVFTTY